MTVPIPTASRSHLAKVQRTSSSRPRAATSSMRSCDSDSMISYGVIPASRWGTREASISMPMPARAGISEQAHASPAAPMSWMPTIAPVAMASRQASSSSFSVNGSPTCTVGRRSSAVSSKVADAMVAPWMPSRPVLAPT